VTNSLRKIEKLDNHIWCATSGVVPDARTLIDHARVETQSHWFNYNEEITVNVCATAVGKLMGHFGTGKMSRPYGVGMLIAGYDTEKGPQLYYVDPSGTKTQFKAKAIGSGQESAQNALKDEYSEDMTLQQAKDKALEILAQVISERITEFNVEVQLIPVA
jgi:20S proteasome subunit alpha 5